MLDRAPFAALAILLVAACADSPSAGPAVALRDSASITIVENRLDGSTPVCGVSPEPTLTIGEANGAPEYQLYRTFGAARLSDGRIAVVNQGTQELRFYGPDGRFLNASGRRGEGPGEFRDAFILRVLPGDTLWVGDYQPWEWEVFAPDGVWQRSVRLQPPYVNPDVEALLEDGSSVAAVSDWADAPVGRFETGRMTVILHAPDGKVADTVGVYDDRLVGRYDDVPGYVGSPMFASYAIVTAGGSRVLTGHTSRPELRIHEVDGTARLERVLRWSADPRKVTSADVVASRQQLSAQFVDQPPALRHQLEYPLNREDRPVAEYFPYFSSVEIGRDGRIWVRSHRAPTDPDDGRHSWTVFSVDGTVQCRVTTQAFQQMPDFGSDYILVMRRDDLGIERIQLHTLGAPVAASASTPPD